MNYDKDGLKSLLASKYFQKYMEDVEYIACSFPPCMVQFLNIIAKKFNKRIILNLGHRFNIRIKTKQANEQLKRDLINLFEDKKIFLERVMNMIINILNIT